MKELSSLHDIREVNRRLLLLPRAQPIFKVLYQTGKHGCIFSAVQKTVFSKCIKIHTIVCHHLIQHCPPPALLSVNWALIARHWFGCFWVMGACLGLLHRAELPLQCGRELDVPTLNSASFVWRQFSGSTGEECCQITLLNLAKPLVPWRWQKDLKEAA